MQINGIIAEYNPFHNGHKYQMTNAKEQTGADYTIIVMSGNFVQRGTPALLDKYKRAEMALLNGADLVLELPTYYSASSAEYFATGAVALLDKLGVVNHLCFGSESGDIAIIERLANLLLEEPAEYTELLRKYLKEGLSYPVARTTALLQYDPSLSNYRDVFSSPNNILGIEYIKALLRRNSKIKPYTTLRVGSDYHDIRLGVNQSSARAIRQAIYEGQHVSCLKNHMPENVYQVIKEYMEHSRLVFPGDLSSILHFKLLQEHSEGYERFLDVSSELSDRISNSLYEFTDYNSFCNLLKKKDMTYTRISRCLLHILLDMTTDTLQAYKEMDYIPYARVLGFRKESTPLLTATKANSSIPLITKLADAENILDKKSYAMLKDELRMNQIYQSAAATHSGTPMMNEFSTPIVIV
uniref:nucleotidyltransferase n=1 Tax=Acetatifactor sp. TaxID=1872090 RepID=UPI0040569425